MLAVSSEYRGLGFGHNLVDAAIQTSKALNLMHITVNTQDYQAPDFFKALVLSSLGNSQIRHLLVQQNTI
ncbi:GNAT family N-acetyltransferase [Weissella confusa]|uniref:GNAT family N-acetyltransferase n=1 Tax=Weissella confusa TaxID=1583 RepID=UPI003D7E23E4